MPKKRSQTPIIVCSDRIEEQVRITTQLAQDCDNIISCQLVQFEAMLNKEPDAFVVFGWLQPSPELRLLVEFCRAKSCPLLVVLKQLNSNDISRLPEKMDYVLLPADSNFPLYPWLEHAHQLRQSINQYEQQIEQLSERLEERKVIERAKGLLMKVHQVDEEEAYRAMRKTAMQSSQSLAQVARNLMLTLEALK
ncbi:ANTAR domain-containing response regulator [Vibrio sinaloensis]|uniref:ANTAR domain-containing response regulator n=1 Tax=Photobacterium sp. (strain ATCC 43367) TaxID=379097 RepID=UPI0035E8472B